VACSWGDHADDSISTLHPGLEIIVFVVVFLVFGVVVFGGGVVGVAG